MKRGIADGLLEMQGQLVRTTKGQWITQPPARCPNGHPLNPNQVLVGHVACLGHGGGHTSWHCRTCDAVVYGPPLTTHCTSLDGPGRIGGPSPSAFSSSTAVTSLGVARAGRLVRCPR